MATNGAEVDLDTSKPTQIGTDPTNHWYYDPATGIIDLTRGHSSNATTLKTTTNTLRLAPEKSALVIIDMQNFFLSPALGRPTESTGLAAAKALMDIGIPAAREKGIRVLWVNWGLTEDEVNTMPPGVTRAFGVFEAVPDNSKKRKNPNVYKGLGADLGPIQLPDGTTVEAGRVLMRDAWNTALYTPLDRAYLEGARRSSTPDVWIHKNRMSALWGSGTDLEVYLEKEGITTLLFAGVNTDQCVGGTLMDAFSKGYDCIFLKDASATSSPQFSQDAWEWNSEHCWGFLSDCASLKEM
ncbi:hypothetical protein DTO169E5_2049 [Paecilomyces variotii]|nr:hypothetical protein DTO169E5_2049 [Paecilomyces variotii]KAJ9385981.1 hypothetical protein DTO063F5_3945 [Paecilomyces variotii]